MSSSPATPVDDALLVDLIPSRLDALIDALDRRIGAQVDEILHHPTFQRLERVWRGLWFVVSRTSFDENIQMELLDCSKEDLRRDLAAAPTPRDSGLGAIVYRRAIGAGIDPYGAILTTYEFGPGTEDVEMLRTCAVVAHLAMAPFIAAASPRMFGVERFSEAVQLANPGVSLALHGTRAFAGLRQEEASRALGLVLPRFLLRMTFVCDAARGASFSYQESTVVDEDLCWGSAAFAFASRLTESFARYRWCPNIIGRTGSGLIEGLPSRDNPRDLPTDLPLTETKEAQISNHGLIALTATAPGEACFLSAASVHAPKQFDDTEIGQAAELNYRLGTQLPYFFIVGRIVHYLKVLYRSYQHAFESTADIERELNDWVGQFVADRHVLAAAARGRRPLRKAQIIVQDSKDEEGWRLLELKVRPHFKYMGAFFTLSVKGPLEKA